MKKRLASLILLLVLLGGAFAGVPVKFGGGECGMHEMMEGMDCCKAALLHSETPKVAEAKLCCELNCAQSGATSPSVRTRITPPVQVRPLQYPIISSPILTATSFYRTNSHHDSPGSPPTYLLNLAFLI